MASSENTAAHEGTRFQTDVGQAETCKVEQIVIGLFFVTNLKYIMKNGITVKMDILIFHGDCIVTLS